MFPLQLQVKVQQQSQEVPVGVDGSFLDQALDGRAQSHVMIQHEVRQDQRGRAAHTHNAMHQHLPYERKYTHRSVFFHEAEQDP